jgi:hypothetical protein
VFRFAGGTGSVALVGLEEAASLAGAQDYGPGLDDPARG